MKVQDVIDYFKGAPQLAAAINIHVRNIYHWKRKGYISSRGCDLIEVATKGKFKAIELRKMAEQARGHGLHEVWKPRTKHGAES